MKKTKIKTNRFHNLFPPGIFLPMIIVLMLTNTGCRKESWIKPENMLDTTFYFILYINGKTYNSAALKDRNGMSGYAPSIHGIFAIKNDSTGAPDNWKLSIHAQAEIIFRANYILFQPSTFTADISLHKKGDLFGQYNVKTSYFNYENFFSDVDGKSYRIDSTLSHFTITAMSPPATVVPYIDGNFDCVVYEMRNYDAKPIRAYGTFRLKAF